MTTATPTPGYIPDRHCYFSIVPPATDHFSIDTPCSSPTFSEPSPAPTDCHPLLAHRAPPTPCPVYPPRPSLMQAQTNAAHSSSASRPRPVPVQNVLQVTSDDSASSDSSRSSMDSGMNSGCEYARCSRCQRTPSLDIRTGKSNMIQYGLNLWYCNRCAQVVGLINR